MGRAKHQKMTAAKENEWFESEKSKFIWLAEQAQFISNRIGRQIASPRQGFATWLWIRACVTSASIVRLFDPHVAGNARYIDHASIAALARALIENLATCIYLGDETVSEEEWDARRTVINLNDLINRRAFLRQIGQLGPDLLENREAEFRTKLEGNAAFISLSRDARGKILNGSNMFLHGRHKAMLVFGWGDEVTAGVYKYLSSHAHSTAMAFARTEANRIYEPDSNASKVTAGFAIDHVRKALGTGCLFMVSLFPYVEAAFDELVFISLKNEYRLPLRNAKEI